MKLMELKKPELQIALRWLYSITCFIEEHFLQISAYEILRKYLKLSEAVLSTRHMCTF